jgi:serine/threonine protein kinase/WD40 repeat protein/Flp pilus assembly protein TadD
MTGPPTGSDPLNALAEEFVERYRRGERPALSEFAARHPDLAEEIQELFPALVMMEDLGSVGGQPAPPGPAAVPEQLGDFRILREIGRGGMGVVYEAAQESLGRHVALKILPFHNLMEASHLERFRREARAAAQLHHTNIVPVFGVGEHEGIHYYAMQYIQGQSLDEVIEEVKKLRAAKPGAKDASPRPPSASVAGALLAGEFERAGVDGALGEAHGRPPMGLETANPPAPTVAGSSSQLTRRPDVQYFHSVARMGVQVADALHYAHRQGILHRDIKPSNLLLDLRGTVWVTDFGLAKAEDSGELTRTGDIVGTVRFMPPERLDGRSEPRGDIYSLGVALYEMLTLRPAFADTQRSRLMERILHDEPPRPRKFDPAIPADLETIVLTAMAKAPADRYATAEALADDLRRFLADRPIRARRSSWAEKGWRWCRRNPGVAGLSGAVAALVVVLLIGSAVAVVLRRDKERAEQAEARAVAAEREVQIRSHLNRAMAYRRSGQSGQRFLCLAEAAEALKLNPDAEVRRDLSREVLACLALPDLHLNPARPWADYPADTVSTDFDDSLEIYARADAQGRCSIRRVAGDQEIASLPGFGVPAKVVLSPNGRFAALCVIDVNLKDGRFQVWQLDGPKPRLLFQESTVSYWCIDFRQDSEQVAFAHTDGAISVYDLATGRRRHHLAPRGIVQEVVTALHPTEPVIAVGSYFSKVVQLRDVRTGAVRAALPHPYSASGVAWHPAGLMLAASCGDDTDIQLYDGATFKLVRTLHGNNRGTRIAFNHAGDRLVSQGWGGGVQLWDVDTGQLLFSTPPVSSASLRFSRDDRWLAGYAQGHKVGVWQVSDGRDHRTLVRSSLPTKAEPKSLAVHKDGRLLAVGWSDGLGFWDLESGVELGFVPIQGGVRSLLFEPSGALLTNGLSRLYRWRVQPDTADPGTLRIGPPEPLALPGSDGGIVQSRDGGVLVQAHRGRDRRAGAWLLHADRPGKPVGLEKGKDISFVSVSPDGRWITTGVFFDSTIKVWEAVQFWEGPGEQRPAKEFTGPGHRGCWFSPDGRWLGTGHDGNRLYAVDSWTEGPQLGGGGFAAFSPDGRLAVLETRTGAVRLVESATGKEVALLEDPNLDPVMAAVFTPDGERLITLTNDRVKGAHVWELKAVRQALRWLAGEADRPPGPLAAPALRPTPLRLDIDRSGLPDAAETGVVAWSLALALQPLNPVAYYRRAMSYATLRQEAEAVADCRRAAALHPGWPALVAGTPARSVDLNNLAWWLAVKPASAADGRLAVVLAEQAVKLDETNAEHRNTLGVAYYRAGRFAEAVGQLQTSLEETRGQADAHNLYFLAMSHQALGEPAKARACYDEAVAWRKRRKSLPSGWDAELTAFHAEAAAALDLTP